MASAAALFLKSSFRFDSSAAFFKKPNGSLSSSGSAAAAGYFCYLFFCARAFF